jgi:hypothetical protein
VLVVAGPLESGTAGVLKRSRRFLASIGVSVVAALEQAERMRKKYNYGETVSRKKPQLMIRTDFYQEEVKEQS